MFMNLNFKLFTAFEAKTNVHKFKNLSFWTTFDLIS